MRIPRKFIAVVASFVLLGTTACKDDGKPSAGQSGSTAAASASATAQVQRHYLVSDKTSGECSTSVDDGLITAADINSVVGNGTKYRISSCRIINYTQLDFVPEKGAAYPSISVGSVKGEGAVAAWKNLKARTPRMLLSRTLRDSTLIEVFSTPGFARAICVNCTDPAKAVFLILTCTDTRTGDYAKTNNGYLVRLGAVATDNMLAHY
jgi:hypothetical protein